MLKSFLAGLCLFSVVHAADLPVEVVVETDMSKEADDVSKGQYGEGQETVKKPKFTATVKNISAEDLNQIGLKLYVIGHDFNWSADRAFEVYKVLTKENLTIPWSGEIRVEMGEVEFKFFQTQKGNTLWRGGDEYDGYVMEIFKDGKLLGTTNRGGKKITDAYKAHQGKK